MDFLIGIGVGLTVFLLGFYSAKFGLMIFGVGVDDLTRSW